MTIKEAILKALEELQNTVSYSEVTDYIIENKFYNFIKGKTPAATISAQLGDFIRNNDSRVSRIKKGQTYYYYLTKYGNKISVNEVLPTSENIVDEKSLKINTYSERSLHILLATYLRSIDIYSRTIFHEKSIGKEKNTIWIHPDMIGVQIRNFKKGSTRNLLKSLEKGELVKFYSYELKREINSDASLKEAYFQALSNSSWANYGYLVAFDFADNLKEEMQRLNQAHGIGFIALAANPFETKILYPATYRSLDFHTIDKICEVNEDFESFINAVEKIIAASEKYYNSTVKEFPEHCDKVLHNDTEIENYCVRNYIPIE